MSNEDKLRAFAQAVMQAWPTGDVDGGDLQDAAIYHGLLTPVKVAAPCNETDCLCAEAGNLPGICYRRTSLLTGKP